jgi:uncharacterized protein (TIGR00661 family)
MARIAVGVMGDSLGHVNHSLALAHAMPSHDFLFIGGGKAAEIAKSGRRVVEAPVPGTYYRNNRVDVFATAKNGLKVLANRKKTVRRIADILREYSPDIALTAYEYFTPRAARMLGIPCVSVDNQHFLTKCRFTHPPGQRIGRFLFRLPLELMYSHADRYMVNSFFPLEPLDPDETETFPPLIMPEAVGVAPSDGDHVVVYQTSPTFLALLPLLQELRGPFFIYGFGERPSQKNLHFRRPSRATFLDELASCRYVVANGGHNVISEALYFGKPVFSFPIAGAYEQFVNAWMLSALGYGDHSLSPSPGLEALSRFERTLDEYRARIRKGDFLGNHRMAARLEYLIQGGPDAAQKKKQSGRTA